MENKKPTSLQRYKALYDPPRPAQPVYTEVEGESLSAVLRENPPDRFIPELRNEVYTTLKIDCNLFIPTTETGMTASVLYSIVMAGQKGKNFLVVFYELDKKELDSLPPDAEHLVPPPQEE